MPVLSIIVPIYNQQQYLADCLNSISAQSFSDYEVILVDDGSTDSSSAICKDFVAKDARFIYVSKDNGGVSSARNVGIEHARGEYVIFVDSDDKLPENALENHLNRFADDVDMTLGSFLAFSGNGLEEYRVDIEENDIVSVDRCLFDFTPNGKKDWQRYLWNRMMRMSIINGANLRFNEKIAYKEDGLFLVRYLLKCKGRIAYFPEIVYNYRLNPSSAMGSLAQGKTMKLVTNIDAHALIIAEMRAANVSDDILGREISHAFQSRHWVLDKMFRSNAYYRAWIRTLYVLLCAVGRTRAMEFIVDAVCGRLRKRNDY